MRRYFMMAALAVLVSGTAAVAQKEEKNKDKEKWDDQPKVVGSGNVITKDVSVSSFDELSVSGVFSVSLKQGGKEELKIEADDNLQELFEVKTEGSKLILSMKKNVNIKSKKTMKVYITFKKLKNLDLKTVGDVSGEGNLSFDDLKFDNKSVGNVDLNLTAKSVSFDNKSVGNVKLQGKADDVVIRNKSVGNISAASFIVQKMDIESNSIGDTEVNAAKEIKVKDNSLGKVTNKGAATITRLNKREI
jgi:hypothetical protein